MNATDNDVRPHRIAIPEAQLHDLRERLDRTRWSGRETGFATTIGDVTVQFLHVKSPRRKGAARG
jgi:hypothetical protein